jgi:hypothetical protein
MTERNCVTHSGTKTEITGLDNACPSHVHGLRRLQLAICTPLKRWTGSSRSNNPSEHELGFLNGLWPSEMRATGSIAPATSLTSRFILLITPALPVS